MIFDEGYFINNRFKMGFLSNDPVMDKKIKMVYSVLLEEASYKNDETNGIVNSTSIKYVYDVFGAMTMSRYLKILVEKGLIEILSKAANQYHGSCIKIIHYQKSQSLKNYLECYSNVKPELNQCYTNVTPELQLSNENNLDNNQIKNTHVTPMLYQCYTDSSTNVIAPACSYIEEQNNRSNRIKNTVDETEQLPTDSNFYDPDSLAIAPSKPVKIAKSKKVIPEGKSVETVNAYKLAYKSKYGVDPIINAATRGQACKLVDAVGKEVAPMLAQFYLTHNAQWYVRNLHKFGLLLSDAEKLHTEMQKGEYMTESMARKADKDSHEQSMMDEIQRKIESGYYQFDDQ
jgi:hypothetical protein